MSSTAFSEPAQSPTGRTFLSHWSPERAVLSHLLDEHPRRITLAALLLEVGHGLSERAIRRAVDNLTAAHFILPEGGALLPAPAVISFDQGPAPTNF